MTFRRLRLFAVLGVLAAAVAALRARRRPTCAVRDDAGLFDKEAADEANERLRADVNNYRLDFFLQTVERPPEDVQKQLREAKGNRVREDAILRDWAEQERKNADRNGVFILICKDAVERSFLGWKTMYGCVVVDIPPEARSDRFTDADAKTLEHQLLAWFKRGNTKKNDAALLSAVARIRRDLFYDQLPPFPWLGVGAVMAGALGLWGALALVRLRLHAPSEPGRPGLFAALLGGMFGGVAAHWIYDTLFVAASRSGAPAEPAPEPRPAAEEKKDGVPVEAAEPPPLSKDERLDLAARDHPTEEPTASGPAPH